MRTLFLSEQNDQFSDDIARCAVITWHSLREGTSPTEYSIISTDTWTDPCGWPHMGAGMVEVDYYYKLKDNSRVNKFT